MQTSYYTRNSAPVRHYSTVYRLYLLGMSVVWQDSATGQSQINHEEYLMLCDFLEE